MNDQNQENTLYRIIKVEQLNPLKLTDDQFHSCTKHDNSEQTNNTHQLKPKICLNQFSF